MINNRGEPFKVVNFTVVSNDEAGQKNFITASYIEIKSKPPETFQK